MRELIFWTILTKFRAYWRPSHTLFDVYRSYRDEYKKFTLPKVSTAKLRRQQDTQSDWADTADGAVKSKLVIEKI